MLIFAPSIDLFQKLFCDKIGYFEYALALWEGNVSKVLHFSEPSNIQDVTKRKKIIFQYISYQLSHENKDIVKKIFHYFQDQAFHVGYDARSHRKKFYVSLYQQNPNTTKESIEFLKTLFPYLSWYQLTQWHQRFDCFGFDIFNDSIIPKIYEIIDISYSPLFQSLSFLNEEIGYAGIMRTFTENERQKHFIRFAKPQDISILKSIGWTEEDVLLEKNPQWNIKYICQEKNSWLELYFTYK